MDYKTLTHNYNDCNFIKLQKDGKLLLGIYNGLSSWGKVYKFDNGLDAYDGVSKIDEFSCEPVEDATEETGSYAPLADKDLFRQNGYEVIES